MDYENQNNNYNNYPQYQQNPNYNNQQYNNGFQYQSNIDNNDFQQKQSSLFQNSRIGFIRKVYLILIAQLFFTICMVILSIKSEQFASFQQNNHWLLYFCVIGMIIVEYAILCYKSVSRAVPTNYICLGVFTFCMGYLISCICSLFGQNSQGQTILLTAALMTLSVTLALTLYAFYTDTDFTFCGGVLCCLSMIIFVFGICASFTNLKTVHLIYSGFLVLLYSMYLIYDTQLIAGGKKHQLSVDDYIIGALMLYIDIVMIFIEILNILSFE